MCFLLQCCKDAFAASGAKVDVVVGCAVLAAEVARLPAVKTLVHVFPLARMVDSAFSNASFQYVGQQPFSGPQS